MISHKYKCIFIHIPKCAGSSINKFLAEGQVLDWSIPNYDVLYGWCPKRKIHLQHATSKQLIETDLISQECWNSYFKFTFVRNPWDRAYSDYLWIMNDRRLKGPFKDYILKQGKFERVMTDNSNKSYRGDHSLSQTDFFTPAGEYQMDFIGRFERLQEDFSFVQNQLGITKGSINHEKRNTKRSKHYSSFYTQSRKKLVNIKFDNDIQLLGYHYEEKKRGLNKIKLLF